MRQRRMDEWTAESIAGRVSNVKGGGGRGINGGTLWLLERNEGAEWVRSGEEAVAGSETLPLRQRAERNGGARQRRSRCSHMAEQRGEVHHGSLSLASPPQPRRMSSKWHKHRTKKEKVTRKAAWWYLIAAKGPSSIVILFKKNNKKTSFCSASRRYTSSVKRGDIKRPMAARHARYVINRRQLKKT